MGEAYVRGDPVIRNAHTTHPCNVQFGIYVNYGILTEKSWDNPEVIFC